ncbi:MAG: hypothetical protein FOGNACKC_00877 [Anaerolineae bacterium]|nr:hypothetical protein [Anaerolineae bacterium]
MSYEKAMKHARNPRKFKVPRRQRNGQMVVGHLGFSVLAPNERRGIPWLGGAWYEPGMEEKRKQFIREWDEETERLLKQNPDLIIVGPRPEKEESDGDD